MVGKPNQTIPKANLEHIPPFDEKVQVGNDQEKAQLEKDSHSKAEVGKNLINIQVLIP